MKNSIFLLISLILTITVTACHDKKARRADPDPNERPAMPYLGYDEEAEKARVLKERCIMSERSNLNLPECAKKK